MPRTGREQQRFLENQAIFSVDRSTARAAGCRQCPLLKNDPNMSTPISRRTLGSQGLNVSTIGLGCMGMSEFYGPTDEAQNLKVLEAALERGINFWDSADMYGMGHNERLLSQLLSAHRDDLVVATKFGFVRAADGKPVGLDGSPAYVRSACEASLSRLGVDAIDLYYLHRLDPKVPIEETVGAMAELVKAGKVRHLGLSEVDADTLRRAHAVHPITALQTEYSLWSRDVEAEILPTCRELGIGFVAYSPLGRGFLTGAFRSRQDLDATDSRNNKPRFMDGAFEANFKIVEAVEALARQRGATAAQIALAWLLGKGDDIVPIPGTRKVARLEENIGATRLQLDASERSVLDQVLSANPVSGAR